MSRLHQRVSIAWAAVVVALFCSTPAHAQFVGFDPGPPREKPGLVNNVVIGTQYDIVNKAKAERRVQKFEAKLGRHSERGQADAADHDVRRIGALRYRIAVDEWLIRDNRYCNPGNYPYSIYLDHVSCAALAQAASPPPYPIPRQSSPNFQPGMPNQ